MTTLDELKELIYSMKTEFLDFKTEFKMELLDLKHNVAKLNDNIRKIENYQSNDSYGIEEEINKNVKAFLKQKYEGSVVKKCKLDKISHPDTNQLITQFDGSFLIEYDDFPLKTSSSAKTTKVKKNTLLVIVEAKHHVTIEQINEKIVQIYKIKEYINMLKRFPDEKEKYSKKTARKIENTIHHLRLNNISQIQFFIGGPTWENKSFEYCQKLNQGLLENIQWSGHKNKSNPLDGSQEQETFQYLKNNINVVIPSGQRYEVKDFSTHQLNKRNIIEDDDMMFPERTLESVKESRESLMNGGGNRFIGFKMVNFPNRLNFEYDRTY